MSSRSFANLPSNVNINDKYTNSSTDNILPENKWEFCLDSCQESNVDVQSSSSSSSVHESTVYDKTVSTHSSTNNVFYNTYL